MNWHGAFWLENRKFECSKHRSRTDTRQRSGRPAKRLFSFDFDLASYVNAERSTELTKRNTTRLNTALAAGRILRAAL